MPLFAAVAGEGSGCGVVSALSLPSVLLAVALEQIPDLVGVGLYMQSGILSPSCKCCLWKAPTAHRLCAQAVLSGGLVSRSGAAGSLGRGGVLVTGAPWACSLLGVIPWGPSGTDAGWGCINWC